MNVYDLLFVHGADVQSRNMESLKLNRIATFVLLHVG